MHDRSFEKALRESLEERSRINRQLEAARARSQMTYKQLHDYRRISMQPFYVEIARSRNI